MAALRRRGIDVITVTPDGFRSVPCPGYREIRLSRLPYRQVARLFDQARPDAIHVATEGPLGWAARKYCRRRGLPFATSMHTRFPEYLRLRAPIPTRWSYAVLRRFHGLQPASRAPSPRTTR